MTGSISRFITQMLGLKGNEAKSATARQQEREIPGFSPEVKRAVAPKSVNKGSSKMAEESTGSNKQRIHIKVTDVETGEEQFSSDIVVVGGFCEFCCSCSNTILVKGPRPPVFTQQLRR